MYSPQRSAGWCVRTCYKNKSGTRRKFDPLFLGIRSATFEPEDIEGKNHVDGDKTRIWENGEILKGKKRLS